jgi:transcriptional regulator with XRE-family HTH domain
MSRKQIGTQIESLRKKLNLSRYKVAQDTGLKLSQIKNIEEAKTGYTVDILLKYTDSLNCKIEIKPKSIK